MEKGKANAEVVKDPVGQEDVNLQEEVHMDKAGRRERMGYTWRKSSSAGTKMNNSI